MNLNKKLKGGVLNNLSQRAKHYFLSLEKENKKENEANKDKEGRVLLVRYHMCIYIRAIKCVPFRNVSLSYTHKSLISALFPGGHCCSMLLFIVQPSAADKASYRSNIIRYDKKFYASVNTPSSSRFTLYLRLEPSAESTLSRRNG